MVKKSVLYTFFFIGILSFLIFPTSNRAFAKPAENDTNQGLYEVPDYNPRAERWIYQQMNAGIIADLSLQFPDPTERTIRASFLQNLIEFPPNTIKRFGIQVKNATVTGDLVVEHAEIDFPVLFEGSTFQNYVSFCRSHFTKMVSFEGGTFESGLNFCETKVDETLDFRHTSFESCVTFSEAEIGGDFMLSEAKFNSEFQKASFTDIKVGETLFLADSSFAGETEFNAAKIGGDLALHDAQFLNEKYPAKLSGLRIGTTFFLGNTSFAGGADFRSTEVEGHFVADDVKFNNPDELVTFNYMKVAQQVSLNRAVFNGETTFREFETKDHFIANDAQFNNKERPVEFINLVVGKSFFLDRAIFSGPANFSDGRIGGDFTAVGSKFNDTEHKVDFEDVRVGNDLRLLKAEFSGPVRLTYLEIGQLLDASDARFNSPTGRVELGESKVGTSIMLNRSVIAGPMDTRYVHVGYNFEAQDAQFTNSETGLYAENMVIPDLLLLQHASFAGPVDFGHTTVGDYISVKDASFSNPDSTVYFYGIDAGEIYLDRAIFAGKIFITNTTTTRFDAQDTVWPEEPDRIDVRGLVYTQELNVTGEHGRSFLHLIEQSPYDGKLYRDLQAHYLSQGRPGRADQVYISYKLRETIDGIMWTSWQWWWNLFLGGFILFGKAPELALFWFVVIILFGLFMFRKKEKMVAVTKKAHPYRPFLYSLDLFLPLIDLGFAKEWKPDTQYLVTRIYAVLHRYLGLILIPIAILAFLGILK